VACPIGRDSKREFPEIIEDGIKRNSYLIWIVAKHGEHRVASPGAYYQSERASDYGAAARARAKLCGPWITRPNPWIRAPLSPLPPMVNAQPKSQHIRRPDEPFNPPHVNRVTVPLRPVIVDKYSFADQRVRIPLSVAIQTLCNRIRRHSGSARSLASVGESSHSQLLDDHGWPPPWLSLAKSAISVEVADARRAQYSSRRKTLLIRIDGHVRQLMPRRRRSRFNSTLM